MDLGTGLTILGSAVGSAKLLEKLLGPTADYIGDGLKVWTERRVENVSRIMQIASRKLGDAIDEHGAVPPKVLRGILDEGSFCDDELAAEYFGGVLASARSDVPRDDRGSSYISLLGRLSTYQIRAHYCFYHIFQRVFFDSEQIVDNSFSLTKGQMVVVIPWAIYFAFMDFAATEDPTTLLQHIVSGLTKEQLVADVGEIASTKLTIAGYQKEDGSIRVLPPPKVKLPKKYEVLSNVVFTIQPTISGIELFLWAHGRPDIHFSQFFQNKFDITGDITIPVEYCKPLSDWNEDLARYKAEQGD